MGPKYLRFENLSKGFPGVKALSGVSFEVSSGSVHALLGENGAGKSTLLKVLSGLYRPDSGRLVIATHARAFRSTADAIAGGVAVIYQELFLVPHLSVMENICLGALPNRGGWVDYSQLRKNARKQLQWLGEEIDPGRKLGTLSLGQRQMVEIAKALARDATVIAFDEPTSSLSAAETDRLFVVIRQLKTRGKAVLYVSHRMDEIFEICDAATVLRDGQHVATFESIAGVTREELVRKMVGRSITDIFGYRLRRPADTMLRVENLTGPGLTAPARFSVKQGEILGFFGLVGAGRTELMKLVYGAVRATGGTVAVGADAARPRKPSASIRHGLVFCPEDRKKEGIIPAASVSENINLSARRNFATAGFISPRRERKNAQEFVSRLSIRTSSLSKPIRFLSGGNQQKVILARWLSERPKVVLLDEPTRGIDVGAKGEIYSIIYDLAERGAAVVVVSSELPEVMGVCDLVAVMRQGKIVGIVERGQATQEKLLAMALPINETSGIAV